MSLNDQRPDTLAAIEKDTEALGFSMASDPGCGSLLRTLAASKPGGHFLELGTGTGLSTAWLLNGMDPHAKLLTVDNDQAAVDIALRHLGSTPQVEFVVGDAEQLLDDIQNQQFDLIFADTWAGKYLKLDETLTLLKAGGLYIIDDMLPQPNWPEGHDKKAAALMDTLAARDDLHLTWLPWSTGLVVAAKR